MTAMRIATFNLQNLRLRGQGKAAALDGAWDRDVPKAGGSPRLDVLDRELTARVIREAEADVVAMQEVFDLAALDFLHDHYLLPAGVPPYPHRFCLPGNDGRGLNVAAMCREAPRRVAGHAALTGADLGLEGLPHALRDRPLFRRDCLMLDLARVTLFVCHFKAPYPDAARARQVREAEAAGVRRIIEARFPDPAGALWIVLGDLNEPAHARGEGSALGPLKNGFATDLLDRLEPGEDWTFALPESHLHSRPDRILVSPRLAREYPDARPGILRAGMDVDAAQAAGGAFAQVGETRPHASDHALVWADFPGL